MTRDQATNKIAEISRRIMSAEGCDRTEALRRSKARNPEIARLAETGSTSGSSVRVSASSTRGGSVTITEIESRAQRMARDEGVSRESAFARLLRQNPAAYTDYLRRNPVQTGRT